MDGLLLAGIILLIGAAGGYTANRINLPAVTGYIIFGLLIGPSILNIVTDSHLDTFAPFNSFALGIIAITIGYELKYDKIRQLMSKMLQSFMVESIFTLIITTATVYLLGLELYLAVLLGILSITTSPTGVLAVIRECQAEGYCSKVMISQLAMDNIFCIILFGFAISIIQSLQTIDRTFGFFEATYVVGELILAIAIGVLAGIIISYLAPRITNNSKLLVILIGVIALCTGVAEIFNLSPILLNMAIGTTIANLSVKRVKIFYVLESIELPVLVTFLTLAGAKLNIELIPEVGLAGIGYILARSGGKILGARLGSHIAGFKKNLQENLGSALMPQAGVAIGLSVIAEQRLDVDTGAVTTIILVGVIFFEIMGPLLVKKALENTGEAVEVEIGDKIGDKDEDKNEKE